MDIIERLDSEELYIDAIDDAISIIKNLRMRIVQMEKAEAELESTANDFYQGAIYDYNGIVLKVSGYQELHNAIVRMAEA